MADSSQDVPFYQVLGLILIVLALKAVFILNSLPSMWIWADESLYYMTAYDLVHLGQAGVPHPGFLNYPPLTSVLISPLHWIGVPGDLGYRLSLIIMVAIQAIGALALYLTHFEIFGFKSRGLLLLLLVAPPAYMGFCLMSETPFVALFLWLLYFYVRQLKTDRLRYAVIVGVLIAAMILTRRVGVGLFASMAVSAALAFLWNRDRQHVLTQLRCHGISLLVAGALNFGWKLILEYGFGTGYGYLGPSGYLERGLLPALASFDAFVVLARKFLSNLSYISMSTWGVCVPLVLWCVFLKPLQGNEHRERRQLLQRLVLNVLLFALFAAFAAALHMFVNQHKPTARYMMFGRYVEYFSPLLLTLAFGFIARARKWRWSWSLVGLTAVLAVLPAWILPAVFFERLNIAPNNMGLSWIVGIGVSREGAPWVLPIVAVALMALMVGLLRSGHRLSGPTAYGVILCLAVFNLSVAGRTIAEKSRTFQADFGAYSTFLSENPELLVDGMVLDQRILSKKRRKRNRWVAKKVLADHVDRVAVSRNIRPFLGKRLVLSPRRLDQYEILFQEEGFSPKIYGKKRERPRQRALPRGRNRAGQ